MVFLAVDFLKEPGFDLIIRHLPLGNDEAGNLGVSPKIHCQVEIVRLPNPEVEPSGRHEYFRVGNCRFRGTGHGQLLDGTRK